MKMRAARTARITILLGCILLSHGLLVSPLLVAAVNAGDLARLDGDLTPVGAERAGNAAGTIPPWTGGLAQQDIDPAVGYLDPYADDPVLFTITAQNVSEHEDQLSIGHREMFRKFPDTYRMNIYPSRRSANWPQQVLAEVKAQAPLAYTEGYGLFDVGKSAVPFPITTDPLQMMWNHTLVSVADDGNLNYHEGDLISAPLIYTTDLELRYRTRYGVYGKMRTWYDHAGENREVPHGSIANGYRPNANLDDSNYYGYNKFSDFELLDLYSYGNWKLGEARLTARLGQQSINWGESLLHVGINGFNPLNFSALARAGVRQDDALVPVNRIYGNLITRNGVSLEAFYALAWEASHLPPCGSIGSPVDAIADPGCEFATSAAPLTDQQQFNYQTPQGNPVLIPRTKQGSPGSAGQYGFSSRYFVEPLKTEFGLYYVNYHATIR